MMQQCKYDEQILDYLYKELSDEQHATFDGHLAGCAACREQVEGFRKVRLAYKQLPPVELESEALRRMTAVLLQQAAQARPPDTASGGGGKLLPLRPRSMRRLILHPASGIMAAAAAALVFVVVRDHPPARTSAPVAVAPPSIGPVPGAAPTPAPVPAPPPAQPPPPVSFPAELLAGKTAPEAPPVRAVTERDTIVMTPSKNSAGPAYALARSAPSTSSVGWTRGATEQSRKSEDAPEVTTAAKGGKKAPLQPSEPLAMADKEAAKKEAAARDEAAAEPKAPAKPTRQAAPPAEADNSVSGAIAQTQERRKDRVIEELANQELGGAPSAPPSASAERYAQRETEASSRRAGSVPAASAAAPAISPPPASVSQEVQNYRGPGYQPQGGSLATNEVPAAAHASGGGEASNNALLAALQEHLRRARCADASTVLRQLEQSFPMTHGLADARALWQQTCQGRMEQHNMEAAAPPAPAASPPAPPVMQQATMNRMAMPMHKAARAPARAAKPAAPPPAAAKAKATAY